MFSFAKQRCFSIKTGKRRSDSPQQTHSLSSNNSFCIEFLPRIFRNSIFAFVVKDSTLIEKFLYFKAVLEKWSFSFLQETFTVKDNIIDFFRTAQPPFPWFFSFYFPRPKNRFRCRGTSVLFIFTWLNDTFIAFDIHLKFLSLMTISLFAVLRLPEDSKLSLEISLNRILFILAKKRNQFLCFHSIFLVFLVLF